MKEWKTLKPSYDANYNPKISWKNSGASRRFRNK